MNLEKPKVKKVIERYGTTEILSVESSSIPLYFINFPKLSDEEQKLLVEARERVRNEFKEEPAGVPFFVTGDQIHDIFGPPTSNYHLWLRKLKKAFDPNGASDSFGYITAKE